MKLGSQPGSGENRNFLRLSSGIAEVAVCVADCSTPCWDDARWYAPLRRTADLRADLPDLRDVILCHVWDDRRGSAKELHDLLEAEGVSVWFSERDIALGEPFLREIDPWGALPARNRQGPGEVA
ncbi:TIR domain-containing protein [Arthrobacter sp. D1-29]